MNPQVSSSWNVIGTWVVLSLAGGALALGIERIAWHVGALGAGATFSLAQWLWLTGRGMQWEKWIQRSAIGVLLAWPVGFVAFQSANAVLMTLVDPLVLLAGVADTPFLEPTPVSTFVYVWVPLGAAGIIGGLIVGCAQVARTGVRGSWRWVAVSGLGGIVAGPALGALFWWSMLSDVVLHGENPGVPLPSLEHTGVPGVIDIPSPPVAVAIGAVCGALYGVLTGPVMSGLLRPRINRAVPPPAAG